MTSLNLFDKEITDLIEKGHNRPAIKHAQNQATYALAAAAGVYLSRLADIDKALRLMKLSIEIQPDNPVLYSNLVCGLCHNECYEEALKYSKIGISLSDASADMFFNHAVVCKNLGLLNQAAQAFRQARDLNPDCAMTHCQLANVLLPLGQYEEGLREDEWRFKAHSGLKACRKRYKKPDWDGKTELLGKKILVFNEQGHGDAIQFSRYIPKLKGLGAHVILEIQPEIHNLYINSPYIDQLVKREEGRDDPVVPLPDHDFIVSVGSLPHYLDPNLDNIPMSVPYIWPMETDVSKATSLIKSDKFKLCIIWAGSPWHTNDKDRSCFLRYFEPVANIPNVQMYSLQQGKMERTWPQGKTILWQGSDKIDVVNLLEGSEHLQWIDLSPHIQDFNETALVLQKLDLLLSVDTSTAHLAGALGLPVWLMLPYGHEWRWRLKWYPTMKIFRQLNWGNWEGLLKTVSEELGKLLENGCT